MPSSRIASAIVMAALASAVAFALGLSAFAMPAHAARIGDTAPLQAIPSARALHATAKTYPIVYKLNGGTQANKQVLAIAKGKKLKVAKLKAPTRANFKFKGWYLDKKLKKKAVKLVGAADKSKRRVYAKWQRTRYPITYNLGGGTLDAGYPKTVKVGASLSTASLKQPTKAGFEFAGWYSDAACTTKAKKIKGVKSAASRTVYAKWTLQTFPIEYQPNGGALPLVYPTVYASLFGLASFPQPQWPGRLFLGWYADEAFQEPAESIEAGSQGTLRLFAKWRERIVVAHRGYTADGAPDNSLDAFRTAAERGFAHVETDVRFTQDGQAVLNHDPAARIDDPGEGGGASGAEAGSTAPGEASTSVTIAQATLEQLEGAHLARFDEFLDLCLELGLSANIELKAQASTREQVASLVQQVDARNMANSVRWTSFYIDLLGYVKDIHPDASFTYLTRTASASVVAEAQMLASDGADVTIGLSAAAFTDARVERCKKAGIPLGAWTLATEQEIALYDPYVTSFTLDALAAERAPEIIEPAVG